MDRVKNKVKPFTTVLIKYTHRISICGDNEFQKIWKKVFQKNQKKDKNEFFWQNLKRDIGKSQYEDIINDKMIRDFDDEFWKKKILPALSKSKLNFPDKQEYWRHIVSRYLEEQGENNAKNTK